MKCFHEFLCLDTVPVFYRSAHVATGSYTDHTHVDPHVDTQKTHVDAHVHTRTEDTCRHT